MADALRPGRTARVTWRAMPIEPAVEDWPAGAWVVFGHGEEIQLGAAVACGGRSPLTVDSGRG
jgi:hypothetical protein